MANTAAHMVDRVLPAVPVRQWVLSLPFDLRELAAFRSGVLSALCRTFVEAVFMRYRACAQARGVHGAQCGAVTFVQRFGSSLNLHVHFHVVVLDGAFTRDERGRVLFHAAPAPDSGELHATVRRTRERAIRWLERHAIGDRAGPSGPIAACAKTALQRGTVRAVADGPEQAQESPVAPPPSAAGAVDIDGFNLEASVRIDAGDDLGRERLCRYGARPALSLERLRWLPGGRVAYRIKKARGGAKSRIMTPLELLARLAALVPPPRYPLVRYHGVLGPRSAWRRDIVPRPRERGHPRGHESDDEARPCGERSATAPPAPRQQPRAAPRQDGARDAPPLVRATTAATSGPVAPDARTLASVLAPNVLGVKHWSRLLGGLLYAATSRVDWATLLRRSFDVDILQCPECGGRLRMLGEITDAPVVRLVLESLALPAGAPRAARARDPTELLGEADCC
jgi:hypothetical protein